MIHVTYDETCDIAYFTFEDGDIAKSKEVMTGVVADLAADHRLMGFEIINASAKLPLSLIKKLQDVNRARKEPRDFLAPGC